MIDMKNNDKCPVCGCERSSGLIGSNGDLIVLSIGSVYLCVCHNCGNVYLNHFSLDRLKEEENGR